MKAGKAKELLSIQNVVYLGQDAVGIIEDGMLTK